MTFSWKPSFETLETREVPALLGLISMLEVVYPPSDEGTLPPPPPPPPPATGTIVSPPPATPYQP